MALSNDIDRDTAGSERSGVYQGVGAQLRYARTQSGRSLEDVARMLRIRRPHLQAIEEGQFDELPGPAYVVGFLRSYARFLGVDTEAVIEQFKEEVTEFVGEQTLQFPEPPQESNVPRSAIIAVALALAGVIYGGWYYLQSENQVRIEAVAPVPDDLIEATGAGSPTEAPPPALDTATTPPVDQGAPAPAETSSPTEPPAPEVAAAGETELSSLSDEPLAAPEGPAAVEDAGAVAVAEGGGAEPAVEAEPEVTPASEPVAGEATAPEPGTALTITGDLAQAPEAPTLLATPPPPPTAQTENSQPRVYGEENTNSRVTLRARLDSWVQVQSRDNELLLTRILYTGDSYRVPDRDDLTLITGNAGGLDILVDGKMIARIGPEGAVRRNISLSPEALISGEAVEDR